MNTYVHYVSITYGMSYLYEGTLPKISFFLVLDFSISSQVLSVVSILVKRLILNLVVYAHTQKIPS